MTKREDLGRLVKAAERIADALEQLVIQGEKNIGVAEIGPTFDVGLVAVPTLPTMKDEGTIYRAYHAALRGPGGDPVPFCGAKASGKLSIGEIRPIAEVEQINRCGSPGCARVYAQIQATER